MVADIRIKTSFLGHRKRRRLSRELGRDCTGYLLNLWIRTAMTRPDGVLRGMDADDIALDAEWEGSAAEFVDALILCGWVDQAEDGTFSLHDWTDHQAWVVNAPARSARAKKGADGRWGRGQDEAEADKHGSETAVRDVQKIPEVGSKSAIFVPQACGTDAASIPQACGTDAASMHPAMLLSSPSPKGSKNNPPVRDKSLTSPRGGKGGPTDAFLAWWAAYPLKVKRHRAWERWKTIKGVDAPTLIMAVQAQDAAGHHVYQSGEKWPHPATWLNDRRWEDEIKPQGQPGSGRAATKLKAMRGGEK